MTRRARRRLAASLLGAALLAPLAAPRLAAQVAPAGPLALAGEITQGGLLVGRAPAGTVALALDGKPVAVAADGRFLVGLDRDARPSSLLTATLADGRVVMRELAVTPRAWAISRLPTLPKTPLPDAEFARIRPAELAAIEAARATPTDAAGWRQRFAWPLTGRISTLFGSQRLYANGEAGSYHSASTSPARPARPSSPRPTAS